MIEIKITGNTPLEALASLTAFGLRCISDPDVNTAANRILEAERIKETSKVSKLGTPASSMTKEEAQSMEEAAKSFDPAADKTGAPTNLQASVDLPPEPYVEDPPHGDPAPAPEPKPKDQPKAPTLVEVRAKGVEVAKKYGQAAVKTILDGFGVPSMTALAEHDRAAFLVKLEGLGEGNA